MTVKHPPSDELLGVALKYMAKAYAPYSHFQVGSSLITDHGQIYGGCNIENAAYPLCLCAEANVIGTAMAEQVATIKEIVVVTNTLTPTPPCGACRQRIAEFAKPETLVHLCIESGQCVTHTFDEVLPLPFNKEQLTNQ